MSAPEIEKNWKRAEIQVSKYKHGNKLKIKLLLVIKSKLYSNLMYQEHIYQKLSTHGSGNLKHGLGRFNLCCN